MEEKNCFYAILGVSPKASLEDLTNAYEKLKLQHHIDPYEKEMVSYIVYEHLLM